MEEYLEELRKCKLDILEFRTDFDNFIRLFVGKNTRKILSIDSRFISYNNEFSNRTFISDDNILVLYKDLLLNEELQDIMLNSDESLKKLQTYVCEEDYIILANILNSRLTDKINRLKLKMLK